MIEKRDTSLQSTGALSAHKFTKQKILRIWFLFLLWVKGRFFKYDALIYHKWLGQAGQATLQASLQTHIIRKTWQESPKYGRPLRLQFFKTKDLENLISFFVLGQRKVFQIYLFNLLYIAWPGWPGDVASKLANACKSKSVTGVSKVRGLFPPTILQNKRSWESDSFFWYGPKEGFSNMMAWFIINRLARLARRPRKQAGKRI